MLGDSSMGLECFFSPVDVEIITANTPLECVSNVSQNFFSELMTFPNLILKR